MDAKVAKRAIRLTESRLACRVNVICLVMGNHLPFLGMREELAVLHVINACLFTQNLVPRALYLCSRPSLIRPAPHIVDVCIWKCHVFCDVNELRRAIANRYLSLSQIPYCITLITLSYTVDMFVFIASVSFTWNILFRAGYSYWLRRATTKKMNMPIFPRIASYRVVSSS